MASYKKDLRGPQVRALNQRRPEPCDVRPGDVVLVGAAASVQFAGDRALRLRVVRVCDKPTYHGWCWLTGYVLDARGKALDKREVYVQRSGLRVLRRAVNARGAG